MRKIKINKIVIGIKGKDIVSRPKITLVNIRDLASSLVIETTLLYSTMINKMIIGKHICVDLLLISALTSIQNKIQTMHLFQDLLMEEVGVEDRLVKIKETTKEISKIEVAVEEISKIGEAVVWTSKIEMVKVVVSSEKIFKKITIHRVQAGVVVEDSATKILLKTKTIRTMNHEKVICLIKSPKKINKIVLDSIPSINKVKSGNMIASVAHLNKKRNQTNLETSSHHTLLMMTEKKSSKTKLKNLFKIVNPRTRTKNHPLPWTFQIL